MSGYDDYSKSNNAIYAENYGSFPASQIARKCKISVAAVRALAEAELIAGSEWHHTSKMYNVTNYYSLEEVREAIETDEGRTILATIKMAEKSATGVVHESCRVAWLDWGGTRNHPRATERQAEGCRVEVRGQTATITRPDGTRFQKRLTTTGFEFHPQKESEK